METKSTITEAITVPMFFAAPDDEEKHSAVILIHEIWGVNNNIESIAKRLCDQGYIVLAPDLFAGTDVASPVTPDLLAQTQSEATKLEAQQKMRAALTPIRTPEFANETVEKLRVCFDYLQLYEHSNGKIAVVGFCFGGTYSFALACAEPDLAAAVPFYGRAPEPIEDVAKITCPVLAFYGQNDTPLLEDLPQLKAAMEQYHKPFEAIVYPNCGHAFFNDQNKLAYNQHAADDAWQKMLTFIQKYL